MDSRVDSLVAAQHGLAMSHQLRARGVEARRIARWVRTGDLVAVRRGVYTTGTLWESWDDFRARPLARVRAAHLTTRVRHVLSHDSAALLTGVPLIAPQHSDVHLSRLDLRSTTRRYGVVQHGARFRVDEVITVAGLPVLDRARTVADLARQHGYRAGLVAADGALRHGVPRAALLESARRMHGWPESLVVRSVIDDADPGAESPGETLAREFVAELGLGEVETQFPVAVRGGVAWCDLRVGRHLIEFDGRVKYEQAERGGVLTGVEPADVVWEERRRQHEVCARGLGMSRLTWADFWGEQRRRAAARVRAEYAVTYRRFGTTLPADLAEFAGRMRGRRDRATG